MKKCASYFLTYTLYFTIYIGTVLQFEKKNGSLDLSAHAIYSISTGKLEGFNNKIKVAKRIGYGYRDNDFFLTLICYLSIPSVRSPSSKNRDEPILFPL